MELHQLRYFVAVAEQRHFTKAAHALAVAQPSVSKQIKRLEDELGAPLFHRMRGNVALTPAGEALLPLARRRVTTRVIPASSWCSTKPVRAIWCESSSRERSTWPW